MRFMSCRDIILSVENKFAVRLKELRGELSQNQLAEVFNVKSQTISAWETGIQETDFDMLIKIAKYFDVSTDFLLGLAEI